MNNEKNNRRFEEAKEVFIMTNTNGWQVIKNFIETKIKQSEAELYNLDIINSENNIEKKYIALITQMKVLKNLLNKVDEYKKIYLEGGIKNA